MLEQAIKCCQKHRCPLLVQKVDRLTRDVETLGRLTKMKNVDIRIASLPNADNFQIHLYGILAVGRNSFLRSPCWNEGSKERVKFGNPKLAELNKTRKHQAKSMHGTQINKS